MKSASRITSKSASRNSQPGLMHDERRVLPEEVTDFTGILPLCVISIIHEHAYDSLPLMFSTSTFGTMAPKSMLDSADVERGVTVI